MKRHTFVRGAVAGALIAPLATRFAEAASSEGIFALLDGMAQTRAHATIANGSLSLALFRPGATTPLRDYALTSQKPLHLLVFTPDLATLTHLHPMLGSDGVFRITDPAIRTTSVMYADATPRDAERQVFRFGAPTRVVRTATSATVAAGGSYRIHFGDLPRRGGTLAFTVLRGDAPATDLRPFLGEQAHLVVLDLQTYAYVHAHPGEMAMDRMHAGMMMHDEPLSAKSVVSPQMHITLPALGSRPIRVFVQFATAAGVVHTATAVFA